MKKNAILTLCIQITIFIISISTVGLYGQPCEGVLNNGIYDFRNTSSSSELASSFLSWYKNQNIQSFEDAKSASGNASIPLKSIIVGMGFNYDESGYSKFQNYVESYENISISEKSRFNQTIKSINPDVIRAWESCINKKGTHVWIEHTKNPREFVLCANWVDGGGGGIPAKITSIDIGSGKISTTGTTFILNGKTNPNTVLTASVKRQIIRRVNDEPFTIAIDVNRDGDGLLYSFSEIKKPCNYSEQSQPVGGASVWIKIDKPYSKKVEIYWTNNGNGGTAQIGIGQSPSGDPGIVQDLGLKIGEKKILENCYVFVRSGFINGGAKADTRPAAIWYKLLCD